MEKITCVIVPVGEKPFVAEVDNDLKALQGLVGGYIEIVALSGRCLLICDEEAKLRNKDGNRRIGEDIVAGQFIVVGSGGDEFNSLTPDEIKAVCDLFEQPEYYTQEEVEATLKVEFSSWPDE